MSSAPASSPAVSSEPAGGGFALKFGISIGFLDFVSLIIMGFYFFVDSKRAATREGNALDGEEGSDATTDDETDYLPAELRLDKATLQSYSELIHSLVENTEKCDLPRGCSICLEEYEDKDMVRVLPKCGNLFHSNCVDHWLKRNQTCPVCRDSISSS